MYLIRYDIFCWFCKCAYFFLDLIDVCFIFSNGSIYDVGIVFHITISIRWKVPFLSGRTYYRRKSQNRCLQNQKVPVLREEIGESSFSWFICVFIPFFDPVEFGRGNGTEAVQWSSPDHIITFFFSCLLIRHLQFGCGGFGFSAYVLRENSRQVGHALGLGSTFHTPPSTWVVSERAAIRLCRLSSSISLMRDSIVFIERSLLVISS